MILSSKAPCPPRISDSGKVLQPQAFLEPPEMTVEHHGRSLAIDQFRLRGPNGRGPINLSQDPMVSLQYAGELIAAFIERAGGSVKGKISAGPVPRGLEPVYVHRQSRTLSDILVELLRESNNYIADQGHRLGGPVSLEKSLQVASEMLATHGLAAAIHLEEGSGISRNDYFSARGLATVLELLAPPR